MARTREADPLTELAALEAALEHDGLARGYVVRGEERYFRDHASESIRSRAVARGFEVCLHDAEDKQGDFQLARLIEDLSGAGLFAAQRLVIVRNPHERLKKVGEEESPLTRALLAFVRSPADPGCVVLSDPSLRADHAVSRAITEAGGRLLALRRLWETPPPWNPDPRQSELVRWTERRARELGLSLRFEQALYVTAATGNDLFALDDQLAVLRASGTRDLREAVSWTTGGSPWGVAEQLMAGNLPRALSGIETLFAGGFQDKSGRRLLDASALSNMLLGALQRGVRTALELASLLEKGVAEGEALERAGVSGAPTTVRSIVARARARPSDAWRLLLEDGVALERTLKSGAGLDANDFARAALRWSLSGAPSRVRG